MARLTISPPFPVPLTPPLGGTGVANASGSTISFVGGSLSIADGASVFSLSGGTSASVLTIVAGKTLRANNTLTLAGTDGTTMTFPSVSQSIPGLSIANAFSSAANATTLSVTNNTLTTGGGGGLPIMLIQSSSITGTASMLQILHTSSAFTSIGAALYLNMASGSGSFTADFIYAANNNALKFSVQSDGTTVGAAGMSFAGGNFAVNASGTVTNIAGINISTYANGSTTAAATIGKIPAGQVTSLNTGWGAFTYNGTVYRFPLWLNT